MSEYELLLKSWQNDNISIIINDVKCNNRFIATRKEYMYNHNIFYTSPVYQLFKDDKRVYVTTNYIDAIKYYNRME